MHLGYGAERRHDGLVHSIGQGFETMELGDIITEDWIIPALRVKDKKQALQELTQRAGKVAGVEPRLIFDSVLQREKLGSTGLGRGIAIPHAKIAALKSINCIFARLETPIAFDSLDGEPVDLIFLLVAPEHASGDHLKSLARISRVVREAAVLERLRAARDRQTLYRILTAPATSHAA